MSDLQDERDHILEQYESLKRLFIAVVMHKGKLFAAPRDLACATDYSLKVEESPEDAVVSVWAEKTND